MNPAISSFVPPVAPQMPAPQAPSSSAGSPQGFAKALSQAQSRETEAPAAEATPEAAPAKPGASAERTDRSKAGKADKATHADNAKRTDKPEGEKTDAVDPAEAHTDTQPPCADPALADWAAALQRPAAPPEAELAKGQALAGEEAPADGTQPQKGGPRGAAAGALGAAKDTRPDAAELARDVKTRAGKPDAVQADATAPSTFQAALAQAEEGRRDAKPVQDSQPAFNAAAAGLQPAGATTRGSEAAAPASVQVPTPATSPEFPKELGVQVSVLAKDGIQQAELHLNPAEMGPISVQIAIDGTQAQVNFGADSATTRQIIESGLPELAASLREAGFTLSGGGVHSQARGREQGGDGERGGDRSGTRAIGGSNETDVTPRRTVGRVSAGGVDLYA
ncbi:flagellar hook-length control protein FliK [Piscinibacter sp. HJYY11]|uniref:flagellar hook-length control protein FliK n=1 Tax=Piscinibacter sp. HJYY11 TaxID=2801333 RepID=UPI00191CF648|nr:flagellar hook-length control protein FliK [Piscinibacter sp. HJYY11]MBL0727665.1 flagellar hook-length control protein FliK [Piscinibacter sp. HJYY11]